MQLLNDYLLLIRESGLDILSGFYITGILFLSSFCIGFVFSIPLALGKASKNIWIRSAAAGYSSFFRGTPLLVQIFIFYFGLSQFEFVRNSSLWVVLGDSLYCGITVLAMNLTAYMSETVRAGMLAVPPGEKEAARAYGLNYWQCCRYIILPRALRIVTPAIGNDAIAQMKATALVSTITVMDMTGVVRRLSAISYNTDALVIAGAIYGLSTLAISLVTREIERRNIAQ